MSRTQCQTAKGEREAERSKGKDSPSLLNWRGVSFMQDPTAEPKWREKKNRRNHTISQIRKWKKKRHLSKTNSSKDSERSLSAAGWRRRIHSNKGYRERCQSKGNGSESKRPMQTSEYLG